MICLYYRKKISKGCCCVRYNQRMGRAIHEQEANLHLKDHADPEQAGFMEETATELGLASKESIQNKKNRK